MPFLHIFIVFLLFYYFFLALLFTLSYFSLSYNYSTINEINADSDLPDDYTFTSNFIWNGLVPAYKVKGADNGLKTFEAEITTPGIHYIVVQEKESDYEYRSNPIIVQPENSDFKKPLRVKEKGFYDSQGFKGDLFVFLNPINPKKLTDKEKELLGELKKEKNFS